LHYGCHLSVVGEDADFAAALFYAQLYVGCEVATGFYAIDVAVVLLRVFIDESQRTSLHGREDSLLPCTV